MNRAVQSEKYRISRARAHRIRLLGLLHAAALVLIVAGIEPARGHEAVRYSSHGFSFLPPSGWQAVPFPTLDPFTLYRFNAPHVEYATHNPYASFTPGLVVSCWYPAIDSRPGAPVNGILIPQFSYEEYLKAVLPAAMSRNLTFEPNANGAGISRHAFITLKTTSRGPALSIRHDVAQFPKGDGIITFRFSCLEERFEGDYARLFEATFRSFELVETSNPHPFDSSCLLNENERYIEEQIERLPDGWRFTWAGEKEYILFSNTDAKTTHRVAERLTQLRPLFTRAFPGPARIRWIPLARLCNTEKEYMLLGSQPASSGHWCDASREIVLFRPPMQEGCEWMKVVNHEVFHQFIHFYTGCAPAPWFDEGFAEYFSAATWRNDSWKIGKNPVRQARIRKAIQTGTHIPLNKFIYLTNKDFLEKISLCYAQAWSFVYFLRHGTAGHGKPGERWARIPNDYTDHLVSALRRMEREDPGLLSTAPALPPAVNGKANRIALQTVFKGWTGEEWQRLEKAWIDFSR